MNKISFFDVIWTFFGAQILDTVFCGCFDEFLLKNFLKIDCVERILCLPIRAVVGIKGKEI